MNRKVIALTTVILVGVIVTSAYAVYTLLILPAANPNEGAITVVDYLGVNVTLEAPAKSVITLSTGLTELVYALGCGDKIVGRDQHSTFPSSVLEKPVVAPHSYNPPLEKILELEPDLLIVGTSFVYDSDENRRILEDAGIAVYIDETNIPETIKTLITNLGALLDAEDRAEGIVSFIEDYENIVQSRVKNLAENEKPKVYLELFTDWNSASELPKPTVITYVGGTNIAADQPIAYPVLSPEFVAEMNPDIIIRMKMVGDPDFPILWGQIMDRPGLEEVNAVKNERVYLYEPVLMQGVRYPVGMLYWAKWIHPELFEDIEPETVHNQVFEQFFESQFEGVYTYP
jgi:iron complex transport system substrate-binding protein